jgi:hypothetical protein
MSVSSSRFGRDWVKYLREEGEGWLRVRERRRKGW